MITTQKLILGDSEGTDAGCQVIADNVKVNDTIVDLDLAKNMTSSLKYKIKIDESGETVEKKKTTLKNVVRYYHDEATYFGEVQAISSNFLAVPK